MCYYKTNNQDTVILNRDIYVLKAASIGGATADSFISGIRKFIYKPGKIYRKDFVKMFLASRRRELEEEVYHSYSIEYSISEVKSLISEQIFLAQSDLGIFRIPKGSKVYFTTSPHGDRFHIATFTIEYISPLSSISSHLILDQDEKATLS